jgi:hypothetical protein
LLTVVHWIGGSVGRNVQSRALSVNVASPKATADGVGAGVVVGAGVGVAVTVGRSTPAEGVAVVAGVAEGGGVALEAHPASRTVTVKPTRTRLVGRHGLILDPPRGRDQRGSVWPAARRGPGSHGVDRASGPPAWFKGVARYTRRLEASDTR